MESPRFSSASRSTIFDITLFTGFPWSYSSCYIHKKPCLLLYIGSWMQIRRLSSSLVQPQFYGWGIRYACSSVANLFEVAVFPNVLTCYRTNLTAWFTSSSLACPPQLPPQTWSRHFCVWCAASWTADRPRVRMGAGVPWRLRRRLNSILHGLAPAVSSPSNGACRSWDRSCGATLHCPCPTGVTSRAVPLPP